MNTKCTDSHHHHTKLTQYMKNIKKDTGKLEL